MDAEPAASRQPFTALDWIGTVVAGCSIAAMVLFPVGSFGAMFRDLGAREELPLLTRMALSPWFRVAFALPAVAAIALGLRAPRPMAQRRAWIAVAFVLGGVGLGLCVVAMYLPIFEIAGKIKAD